MGAPLFPDPPERSFRFDADPLGIRPASQPVCAGSGHATMAAKVSAFFKARPGQWIDGRELMVVAGSYGWRTRVSDIRKPPYSMRIDNRQRGVGRYTVSEYMFVEASSNVDLGGAA